MGEAQLTPDIMNALIENTKTIDANTEVLKNINEGKDKKEIKDKNLVSKTKVSSSLTSDEKLRYANIGKEMFSPIIKSLEKMLKKEKKANEMRIGNDEETTENNIKIQYETKPDPTTEGGESWLTTLLNILAAAGIAVMVFKDKIIEFFNFAYEWIEDAFTSITSFFDFTNPENPVSKILDSISSGISSVWILVKEEFTGLGNLGSIIWDGIKTAWDKFITGPDGILNFGIKIVKSITDFAESAFTWIGDAIYKAVIDPLKNIFGGAEEQGKKAAEEAAADVKVSVSQEAADQMARQKAIRDDVIFSAEKADAAIIKAAEEQYKAAQGQAKAAGLQLDKDGTINKESMKLKAAEDSIRELFKSEGANYKDFTEDQRAEVKKVFAKHISITDKGKATVDTDKLKKELMSTAIVNWADPEQVDRIVKVIEEFNSVQDGVQASLTKWMQTNADIQAAKNLKNMSEEERFEARMRQAMAFGKSAEFRFMEGRKMILDSVEIIKSAFIGYDETIRNNFTETWKYFLNDFMNMFKVEIEAVAPQDNSKNTYHITPLNRESFKAMSDGLLKLALVTAQTIIDQNKILDKIKVLLEEPPPQKIIVGSQQVEDVKNEIESGVNYVAQGAKQLANDVFSAVSSTI